MVVLTKGKESSVTVLVESSINLTGFSAVLTVGTVTKTISQLKVGRTKILFSSGETAGMKLGNSYGNFIVKDGNGNQHMAVYPVFQVSGTEPRYPQTLDITVVGRFKSVSSGGSGGGVTEEELYEAITDVKKYADDKISDIGTTIIETQPVTVEVPGEEPVTMTVQEAVANIIKMNDYVEQAEETHLQGGIIDKDGDGQPDDDTLYFNTGKH